MDSGDFPEGSRTSAVLWTQLPFERLSAGAGVALLEEDVYGVGTAFGQRCRCQSMALFRQIEGVIDFDSSSLDRTIRLHKSLLLQRLKITLEVILRINLHHAARTSPQFSPAAADREAEAQQ